MTFPYKLQTSPQHENCPPPRGLQIFKHQSATCHIVCQLPPHSPSRRRPPPAKPPSFPPLQQVPPPLGRGRKRPKHPPPTLRLRTLNTSDYSTIPDLARLSVILGSTSSCTPTHTKPESSEGALMTSPLSPLATSTQTTPPPPPPAMHMLPLVLARAVRQRSLRKHPPLNKLRARRPLRLKRDRQTSQVPNDGLLLPASLLPLTQTPPQSLLPSPTSPLVFSTNPTASCHSVSRVWSTPEAQSP